MELVFPTIEHKNKAIDFKQEHFNYGEQSIHGGGGLSKIEIYEDWLEKIQLDINIIANEDKVPASVFFGVHNGKIVGIIQIRHCLNDWLYKTYGNIGYGIRPTERRKGYATQMLALALIKCREFGMDKVLISCDKDNIASAKTILKNGGMLDNEFSDDDGMIIQRYWIDLTINKTYTI